MRPKQDWGITQIVATTSVPIVICDSITDIIEKVVKEAKRSDHIVIMSNSGFDNIHEKLAFALDNRE
jgi:UDP-N-acetylmuramate: L-alanyl-gamma-D-glutamyl-meso-diaminopimelate ligase